MKRFTLLLLLACGPGPTEPATPAPTPAGTSTTKFTPTKPVAMARGPDCNARAMEKLVSTITDAGTKPDVGAGAPGEGDEVQPPNATATVQKLAPQLTACNPAELEGCAFFTTAVAGDGAVTAVDVFVSDGLPGEVVACLVGVLKTVKYEPVPRAGKMTVPVTFTRH